MPDMDREIMPATDVLVELVRDVHDALDARRAEFLRDMLEYVVDEFPDTLEELEKLYAERYDDIWMADDHGAFDRTEADSYHEGYANGAGAVVARIFAEFPEVALRAMDAAALAAGVTDEAVLAALEEDDGEA